MDNFKIRNKKPSNNVDGIIMPKGRVSKRTKKTNTTPQPSLSNRLDNFGMKEGFHAAEQPSVAVHARGDSGSLGRNPVRDKSGQIDLAAPKPAGKVKKPKKPLTRKKKILRGMAIFLTILVLIGGFLFAKGYIKLRHIFKGGGNAAVLEDGVDPNKLRGEGDGRVNILLLGRGGGNHDAPDLTDTILIASIDPINKKAGMLSVPRDLWVKTDNMGSMKINAVFALTKYAAIDMGKSNTEAEAEGFAAIEKEISEDMGIPIHYHAMVDFKGFEDAINTVGGVDINVDANGVVYERLWDELTGRNYTLDVREGQQHFDGQRALYYARSRHTSVRGDFDRAERQRKILLALKDKVLSAGTFANPARLSALISNFGDHVQTNMTIDEMMQIYGIGKDIGNEGIASISLVDEPNNFLVGDMINGQSVQVPKAGLYDFSAIQSFVRNTLKDGFIEKENPEVIVLNGTTVPGLATTRADELKSFGYRVTLVDSAPTTNYQQTTLIDLRGGTKKYTKHYLEMRLGVAAVSSLPDPAINSGTADFVIIVGQNEAN